MQNSYKRFGVKTRLIASLHSSLHTSLILLIISALSIGCGKSEKSDSGAATQLRVEQDEAAGTISIFRADGGDAIVTQNAREDHRPYLHPIEAPDGKGPLTEYSPGHHKHQTGLFWGFTRVNGTGVPADTLKKWFYRPNKPEEIAKGIGRDFYHNYAGDYWQRVSASVLQATGEEVMWQTVYNMLDEDGNAILEETQRWSMREQGGKFFLSLEWNGEAKIDITINEFDYGSMFLRMPWRKGIEGQVVNASRQVNSQAEGQRSTWVDVGMQVEGRDDLGHIAIFDHPSNGGYPTTWRVDGQLGVGPARARLGDWKIEKGKTETIRHQIVAYTGDLNDIELTELWQEFTGSRSTSALWRVAQEEGLQEKFLTATEAAEAMTVKDGFQVNAYASEPMITQPMAFCWDDRGRMWIAENRDYENRREGFSNSGDSKILILEDTDRDGVVDSRKVFLEGIPFPSAIAVGFDGIFLAAPPYLLFVPDKNGDDLAEMDDVEILLTGWGIRDRHETINSLHWGPDGWLYGLEGFATPSKIRKPTDKARLLKHKDPFPEDLLEADGVDINGGVWRYHPTKDRFEVVSHGFSNPWGIDYDAKGQILISACVIPHLFHVIPGGIYHRQGGQHFNPYIYSDIRTIVNHKHRSAHGGARVYLSDAFPQEQYGRIFMANIHEHSVLSDVLETKGSGFVASHGDDFLLANNAQWVGFSMEIGPEGGVYVLDWHDADICGSQVLHKETGRIFRITPETSLAEDWDGRYSDLKKMNDEQLVNLQTSKSAWHARRARVILQHRAAEAKLNSEIHEQLRDMFDSHSNADYRLRAMWTLHITAGFKSDDLIEALDDDDEYIRGWAIQMLCEDNAAPAKAIKKFAEMAEEDESAVVRLYLSAALQRMDHNERWDIAERLVEIGEDADDHNIPKMVWFAIEPLMAEDPDRALALAGNSNMPMIVEFLARRAVDANEMEKLVAWIDKLPDARIDLLKGMLAGLEGQLDVTPPANWAKVYAELSSDDDLDELATSVAQQFGDIEAASKFMATLNDKDADPNARRNALNGLASQQREELVEILPDLLNDDDLRIDAIRAFAAFGGWELGQALMRRYDSFNTAEKLEAVQTLASRTRYGWILTQAIKNETIPKSDVPAYAARQLIRVVGSGFLEVWGPVDQLSSDKAAAYAKYKTLLTGEAINAANQGNGKKTFDGLCGACHKMYGQGGTLGPDITGSNRTNLDYLLSNILDPSGEMQDAYKMAMVTTRDGRTYAGNVANENDRTLTIRVVGQDEVVISKSNIQSHEKSEYSMMPEGQLQNLSDQEVTDLIAYLMSSQPISMKE